MSLTQRHVRVLVMCDPASFLNSLVGSDGKTNAAVARIERDEVRSGVGAWQLRGGAPVIARMPVIIDVPHAAQSPL
jgi:hypothetical protein